MLLSQPDCTRDGYEMAGSVQPSNFTTPSLPARSGSNYLYCYNDSIKDSYAIDFYDSVALDLTALDKTPCEHSRSDCLAAAF